MRVSALVVCLAALTLSGCSSKPRLFAPQEQVLAARYVAPPPAEVRILTVINKKNGGGEHTGMLINGSQRVLFDPAGTFNHPAAPERHDVHYGINDRVLASYMDYHVREIYDVIVQTVPVSQSVADDLIARSEKAGPVADALCATAITSLLRDTPGFEALRGSMFPKALAKGMRAFPGVSEILVTSTSVSLNSIAPPTLEVKVGTKGLTN